MPSKTIDRRVQQKKDRLTKLRAEAAAYRLTIKELRAQLKLAKKDSSLRPTASQLTSRIERATNALTNRTAEMSNIKSDMASM